MAVRQTGFALFCSDSVQSAQDFALISHLAALKVEYRFYISSMDLEPLMKFLK